MRKIFLTLKSNLSAEIDNHIEKFVLEILISIYEFLHLLSKVNMKASKDFYSKEDRSAYNRDYFQNNKATLTAMNRTRLKLFQRRRRMIKKVIAQVKSTLKKNHSNCDPNLM